MLTPEQLARLASYDSATIANAIEHFKVRPQIEGYASMDIRCQMGDYPPMVGYAVTCTADSTTEDYTTPNQLYNLYKAIEAAGKPAIVILKDVSQNRRRSCHAGDVMSSTFNALGAVGLVTDGGVRDLAGIRQRAPGFNVFAAGTVVSHGMPRIVEVGVTVELGGLTIRPGDLLHGDANGLVSIPHSVAAKVHEAADAVLKKEAETVAMVRAPGFQFKQMAERYGWH
jgi:regulator of RNase E activity RraA